MSLHHLYDPRLLCGTTSMTPGVHHEDTKDDQNKSGHVRFSCEAIKTNEK